ncbi:hypothetical protein [Draconibacterium halophilum]|uniref:Uncharacterized protein n=1 Tax=Draconibacterium halophilum TaxID=2706887 RepID=A0A6C0REG5_9BACT|nr:hypothetical protein [Draconibacterium halophilum]QIA08529.1 hypothetical protein G0Q07_12740 [Draconibacterium halophilum]
MSYQEDFEQLSDEIQNVPMENVKTPNRPVDEIVERTETLAVDAAEDSEALAGGGLDVTLIPKLTTLSGALRYCQAEWMSEYRARKEARIQWNEESPQAFALRDELLHHYSFAYRNREDLLNKVTRIREGGSNADMVQDLVEAAILGEKNPEPLVAINFEMDLLPQARTVSHRMSELLAAVNGSGDESSETKVLRDKAFTLLNQVDSTIREYGRYVFWKDDDKRDRYKL